MALIRWNPGRELATWDPYGVFSRLESWRRDFDRMFDSLLRGGEEELTMWAPSADISESDDAYEVRLDLPGVSKDDVKITLENRTLCVQGERKQEKETKGKNYHRMERVYGSFQRTFTLPSTVKTDKIDAKFKDGVLTITLPKAEEAKPKQIEIKVD
ncbi:MAG: Hsp20/alpha crystallin family protein [Bacteroidota bacterium]